MGAFLKLFSALLALCTLQQGLGGPCNLSDITIRQVRTGGIVEGKPEYRVTVSNKCGCLQSNVMVKCYGLSSVETVNPRAVRPVDEERCIIGSGQPISRGSCIIFKYAWMTPQDFPVVSSKVHC